MQDFGPDVQICAPGQNDKFVQFFIPDGNTNLTESFWKEVKLFGACAKIFFERNFQIFGKKVSPRFVPKLETGLKARLRNLTFYSRPGIEI